MLKVLDLFSGIGGFSLGLEATGGFQTVAFCEIDPFCRRVLAKHWPGVPILDDVRTDRFPDADIIVGGFPCQDVSRAGKRAGVSGERSGLYRELVRAVRLVGPKYAILENVAALLADGMGDVLGDLAEGGACVEWDCVPACALGAPHERDRVWIVAHANGVRCEGANQQKRGRTPEAEQVAVGAECAPPGWHDVSSWDRGDAGLEVAHSAGQRCGEAREFQHRPDEVPSGRAASSCTPHTPSIGRGPGRPQRPPDSFAWIRDPSRWDFADAASQGLEGVAQSEATRGVCAVPSDGACNPWQHGWPSEPALLGVDDGLPDWSHRVKALGNTLLPQIPYLIGRAILDAEAR